LKKITNGALKIAQTDDLHQGKVGGGDNKKPVLVANQRGGGKEKINLKKKKRGRGKKRKNLAQKEIQDWRY